MKKRVLLVSPYSKVNTGGIGTWTKNILDYHETNGTAELIHMNTAFRFKSNLVNNIFQRILQGVIDGVFVNVLFFAYIIKFRPQTVHYTSSASYALVKDLLVIIIAKLFGLRFIIHWHFGRIPSLIKSNNIEWHIFKRISQMTNLSIVLDKESLLSLKESGINNIALIPNPISADLSVFAGKFNTSKKTIKSGTFVFVGHIIPAKGVIDLIKACCEIKAKIKLLLIGPVNDQFRKQLTSLAVENNRSKLIEWIGEIPREDVFIYLESANALCLPSYTEGFPNVIIEAMAFGCPIIATRVGAIEEMVISDDFGPAGICIEPSNIQQLIDALDYVMKNSAETMEYAINGNKRVISKYTLQDIYHHYENEW